MKKPDVLLVHMPFGPITTPSIGLSLLKASVERLGLKADILYFNLRFAELLSIAKYRRISEEAQSTDLVGEWIFSESLTGPKTASDILSYIDRILRKKTRRQLRDAGQFDRTAENVIALISEATSNVEPFLSECLERLISSEARVIGFSSVFQQQVAALSLAKRLKRQQPQVITVFGGGNCEGVMGQELLKQFGFVDIVVSGEGDKVFPEIVQSIVKGDSLPVLDGVFSRAPKTLPTLGKCATNAPLIFDLDSLPWPQYDDYYEQLGTCNLTDLKDTTIPFETARGCWWGEKHHCTFCGLNGNGMKFRSKSPQRALQELTSLSERYPGATVNVVDNILDMTYFRTFLPLLARRKLGLKLGYEVKSNLTKNQLRALSQAGIVEIQPGIESFSDSVLALMRKGVTGIQNIQLLKWCAELNIHPVWNLIFGFPGEQEEEYRKMTEMVPLLTHLPPPYSVGPIRTDRFSPNFDRAAELGFKELRPYPSYRHVYGLPAEALRNLAVFFTYSYQVPQNVKGYTSRLVAELRKWDANHETSSLVAVSKGLVIYIFDTRDIALEPITILSDLNRDCYKSCDQARSLKEVHEQLLSHNRQADRYDLNQVQESLGWLCERKLVLNWGHKYLALAIDAPLAS